MMYLLIALLAAVASAGSLQDRAKDEKNKQNQRKMHYGGMSAADLSKCMEDKGVKSMKDACTTDFMDSSDCECGLTCQYMDFGSYYLQLCMQCSDFGTDEQCTKLTDRKCVWDGVNDKCLEPMKKDEPKKDEPKETEDDDKESVCTPLKGKKCKKNKMCKVEGGKCVQAYEDQCYGKIEGNHGFCYEHQTKEECFGDDMCKQTPLGKTCKCEWGFNKHDREVDVRKCVVDTMGVGKKCSTNEDCGCGTVCWDFFKSCSVCQDLGMKEDCDAHSDVCKWVAGDLQNEEGICLRRDMCREQEYKVDCVKYPMCQYTNDGCTKRVMNKKGCKKLSGHKTRLNADENTRMKRACMGEPNCKWSAKKFKCGLRK